MRECHSRPYGFGALEVKNEYNKLPFMCLAFHVIVEPTQKRNLGFFCNMCSLLLMKTHCYCPSVGLELEKTPSVGRRKQCVSNTTMHSQMHGLVGSLAPALTPIYALAYGNIMQPGLGL